VDVEPGKWVGGAAWADRSAAEARVDEYRKRFADALAH
jgi:hypothetical protein